MEYSNNHDISDKRNNSAFIDSLSATIRSIPQSIPIILVFPFAEDRIVTIYLGYVK